ncbi:MULTISPECIES: LamG-like jellyroll fold domain-containing protein [unclassified Rathayibacter]|uniref:LamG-like jellyroll fold domain-containing protein n=1 Tax=unclassified Rathayibacter TaxID=2609250 RepID=UPI00188A8F0C|nr:MULTISPECIES: LamG-like jellyroll fold domain-containing protein [unclassified Rathayibacter]MBF4461308.1 family 43 glycosylhydrolase [Rathayibacter sp. VKM Ac-2879]MBF4502719.1 family 43 glycosylhydrolase [Rathayibacter sp. VKM Ac-2878]
MRLRRTTTLLVAASLTAGGLVLQAAPAQAAVPSPILSYDFSASSAVGTGIAAGATFADAAGSHPGTLRGTGATTVAGPRGGTDRALKLPGGNAGSSAAYVEIAPGLTTAATTDLTMSAWLRWDGNQSCSWAYSLGQSSDRYLFTTPQCGGNLIGAVKNGSEQRATANGPAATGRWSHVAVVLRSGVSVSTYVDGTLAQTTPTTATGAAALGTSTFSGLLGKSFYGGDPFYAGAIDDVHVYSSALTQDQVREEAGPAASAIAASDAAAARVPVSGAVTSDIALPLTGAGGSTLTWASSNTSVIGTDGTVRRPAAGSADANVTLTPTATFAGSSSTGSPTTVTVTADTAADAADRLRTVLIVPPVVASGTTLPTVPGYTVTWTADGAGLSGGVLTNSTATDRTLKVTATVPIGSTTLTKTFTVSVLSSSTGRQIVSYTRTPSGENDANQDSVARSLHLALGTSVADAAPLSKNGGILFADGEFIAIDRVDHRSMANPSLFTFADGTIGVIATRVLENGGPDGTETSSALVFKAKDAGATDFDELGLLDLGTTNGVAQPRAVYDSAQGRYLVSWKDSSGATRSTTVTDLARTELRTAPFWPENGGKRSWIVSDNNRGTVRSGVAVTIAAPDLSGFASRVDEAVPAGTLAVPSATATSLLNRLGRVVNTGVTVAGQTIPQGDTSSLSTVKANLSYSDGSTGQLGVDWNQDQLKSLATAAPGTYNLSGTVRQHQYSDPFAYNRADPTIYRYEHNGTTKYLFIATDDTNNNNIASSHLPIRVADTIDQLADDNGGLSREVDLLNRNTRGDRTAEGRVIAGCYWAPEIHEIGGKLSILFAPCFNPDNDQSTQNGAWYTVQAHIMQMRDGGDPGNPADWSKPSAILKSDGSALGRVGFSQNISLDMTYFESGGTAYYAWSQRYTPSGQPLSDPATWIAKVDPANPTRVIGEPVPIIVPSVTFEEHLSEGAFAVQRNGKITLIYSSDSVSPKYIVGGAWADESSDLTDINSWHKYDTPLLKSEAMPNGVVDYRTYKQGPGHGAVTQDEDGNDLFVYHTWGDGVGGNGRDTRISRIHYAADGRPILDMTRDEEVLAANRSVTTTVVVTGSLSVSATATTRCVGGKVVLTGTAKNDSRVAVDLTTTSTYGSKTATGVAPGANSTTAFTTRAVSVPAGSITVKGSAVVNGKTITTQATAAYAARSCG